MLAPEVNCRVGPELEAVANARLGRRERSLLMSFGRAVSGSGPIVDSALRAIGGIDDAVRLPVRRHRPPGAGVDDHDAHRRDLGERLETGPRVLTTVAADCEAKRSGISSAAALNSGASCSPARKKLPTCPPRWRIAVPCNVFPHISASE